MLCSELVSLDSGEIKAANRAEERIDDGGTRGCCWPSPRVHECAESRLRRTLVHKETHRFDMLAEVLLLSVNPSFHDSSHTVDSQRCATWSRRTNDALKFH